MPKSRHYYARDIISLAQKAIELSGVSLDIKKQSSRKYYATVLSFVNEKARKAKDKQLPDTYSFITDYRFFINNYEKHLEEFQKEGKHAIIRATTSYINTLIRCTEMMITPVITEKKRQTTTNDLVDRWTMIFRRQNDLKGYNLTAEIIHGRNGKQITLEIKQKLYRGLLYRQHDYFIATIKQDDIDIVIRINEDMLQQGMFFTGTFMGKLPVYNQYPTGEIFMIRAS